MTHSTAPAHPKKAAYTRAALCLLLSVLTFCYAGPLHQDATTVLAAKRILPVYSVERDDRVISISFDASWGGDQTMRILDLLDEYNAKATFFLVGIWVDKYPELVKEIHDRGHEIGNHSSKHPHMTKISESRMRQELSDMAEKLEAITGEKPNAVPSAVWGLQQHGRQRRPQRGVRGGTVEHRFAGLEEQGRC